MVHVGIPLANWSTHSNTYRERKEPEMCKICALKQNKEWGNNSKQACTSKKQPDGQNVMSKGKMKVTASQFPIRSIFQCISSVFRWVKSTVQSVHQVFNVSDYISKTYFQMFHLVVFVFFFF